MVARVKEPAGSEGTHQKVDELNLEDKQGSVGVCSLDVKEEGCEGGQRSGYGK